jgi:general secretion pathway protein A
MYERFFGFTERPFDLTPNPRFIYWTSGHREAMSNLEYGITGRKGITLLIGDAGTGKTTVVRQTLDRLQRTDCRVVILNNPTLTRAEFVEFLALHFGLSPAATLSKARFLLELERSVAERHAAGGLSTLIVDEAQSLPDELLEEVRLIANLETATEKLLPVVLAGQPELSRRLNEPGMRQLKQRVALRCELKPFDLAGTTAYIESRIHVAGGHVARVFTRRAVDLVHSASRGIPRTISVICDNALISAFGANVRPVGGQIVSEVCRDFDFRAPRVMLSPAATDVPASAPAPRYGSVLHLQPAPTPWRSEAEPTRNPLLDWAGPHNSLHSRKVLR